MDFSVQVPKVDDGGSFLLTITTGNAAVFLGANGAGKTRLASFIEGQVSNSHRIPAQRSIQMADRVTLTSYDSAIGELHHGNATSQGNKRAFRWGGNPEIFPINDFEVLLRALFADQNRIAVQELNERHAGKQGPPAQTRLRSLKKIWEILLPHRKLDIRDAAIWIEAPEIPASEKGPDGNYVSSQLSDGERSIFYLLGQCLLAPEKSLIIVDEPELHIHRAILTDLWDAIEAERSDCGFLYCTHDLDFAIKRGAADRYFVRRIQANSRWQIEAMPEETGIPEDVLAEIAGSRQPILFVEGEKDSLDLAVYSSIYPHLKVQPMGGCEAVIHSVASFTNNRVLHQYGPVFGCVDADHRPAREIVALQSKCVFSLPVAEIENVYLLPDVFQAVAETLSFDVNVIKQKLVSLKEEVFKQANADVDAVAARYAARRIDRALKKVTLNRRESDKLVADFSAAMITIKPQEIVRDCKSEFELAIAAKDFEQVLALYDNKHLITIAAKLLDLPDGKKLSAYASRVLAGETGGDLRVAISRRLPKIG